MTPVLQTAGWALIHFVWQGAAIAAVVATALHLLEHCSANARYIVACVGLAAMLAAPAATARVTWASAGRVAAASQDAGLPPSRLWRFGEPRRSSLAIVASVGGKPRATTKVQAQRSPDVASDQ